ncbi:hypothetical protein LINGRAHAP2_LOCUS18377 [Linum grandiflorum]
MELSVVMVNATTWSCFFLSIFFFSIPLAFAHHTVYVSGCVTAERPLVRPSMLLQLPRKLRLLEEVASIEVDRNNNGDHRLHDDNMYKEEDGASTLSGKSYDDKKEKEDEDEEEEGIDTTQYYTTMDYSRVRKRRPIHNKSLPRSP